MSVLKAGFGTRCGLLDTPSAVGVERIPGRHLDMLRVPTVHEVTDRRRPHLIGDREIRAKF